MNLALAIHSMLPNELDKVEEEEEEEDSVVAKNNNVELKGMMSPATPGVPYTPRTMAFRTLDRKGPSTYASSDGDKRRTNLFSFEMYIFSSSAYSIFPWLAVIFGYCSSYPSER